MMKKQIGSLILISTLLSGCGSQLAVISSTAGLAASHNSYVKAYNGLDLITTFTTEKDIKTHLYETAKATIKTAKVIIEEGKSEIKIYNKKYYSGNLTGEKAEVAEVKEETLVSPVKVEPPKVEKVEKQQTTAFKLCYLSFCFAISIAVLVFVLGYGFLSLSRIKKPRKVKKKIKIKKRKVKKKRKGRR